MKLGRITEYTCTYYEEKKKNSLNRELSRKAATTVHKVQKTGFSEANESQETMVMVKE